MIQFSTVKTLGNSGEWLLAVMEAQNLTLPVEITLVDTHPVNPQHQGSSRVASQKHKP